MLNRIVKFREKQGPANVVWSTGNVYCSLVAKCFEMATWKTQKIGARYDKDKCHMTERWPFK